NAKKLSTAQKKIIKLIQIKVQRALRTLQDMDWAQEKICALREWKKVENSGNTLEQDSKSIKEALLHSAVIAYVRPFSGNKINKVRDDFVFSFVKADQMQGTLHKKLMLYRNKSMAHSDSDVNQASFKYNKRGEWQTKFADIVPTDINEDEFLLLIKFVHREASLALSDAVTELCKEAPHLASKDVNISDYTYALRMHRSGTIYQPPADVLARIEASINAASNPP
ncbi:MAG: hypothetical protein HY254_02115, partial [Burkholderiales bacterium]|nr:hypothetical protein [Burkholderiales bacterium]